MQDLAGFYRAILNAINEPLFVISSDLKLAYCNSSLLQALPPRDGIVEGVRPWFWKDLQEADISSSFLDSVFQVSSGKEYPVKLKLIKLSLDLVLVQLIGGLGNLDEPGSFHKQRLQTLGMLSAGVAHDFNNVLTGILGHLSYLKIASGLQGQPLDSLNSIEDGARRASDISKEIVRFSKTEGAEKSRIVDLSDLLRRTCRLLRGAIPSRYDLQIEIPEGKAVSVLGLESRLAQVLVNLVVNARDACDAGGVIKVKLSTIDDPGKLTELLATEELPCDSYAILKVEDNGHGMSPEVLDKIFEPYFSTKADKGTGIGLSTVLNIVRSLGGAIEVESAPQKGTEVSVYLPLVQVPEEESAQESQAALAVKSEDSSRYSVLIVDDEYTVRNVLSLALQHLGYTVVTASSGPEAISKLKASEDGFDLILLDMLMPQMSGERTFFEMKTIDPDINVLIISGFAPEESIRNVLDHGGLGFVQKPFSIEALSARMNECLKK